MSREKHGVAAVRVMIVTLRDANAGIAP